MHRVEFPIVELWNLLINKGQCSKSFQKGLQKVHSIGKGSFLFDERQAC